VTWIRRTRIGGDSWGYEVPLGEEVERYVVEILDPGSGAVVRSIELSVPTFTYTTAAQVADFGAPVAEVRISVSQISQAYGRGTAAEATLQA